ncbi:hypothetical protein RCL1_003133 [Eukaryota sp. TZLM3-RCL]
MLLTLCQLRQAKTLRATEFVSLDVLLSGNYSYPSSRATEFVSLDEAMGLLPLRTPHYFVRSPVSNVSQVSPKTSSRATEFVSLDEPLRGFSLLLLDAVAITCCQYSGPFSFFLFPLSLNCWIPDLTVCGDVHSNPGPPTHRIPFNLNDTHTELPNKPTLRRNDINFLHPSNLRYANPHLVPLYQAHHYPDELQSLPKIVAIDIETYSEDDPQDLVTHDQLNSFRKNQADQRKDDEELQLSFINEQRVFLISCIFGFLGSMNNMPTVFVSSTHLIINKYGRMNRNVDHNRIKLDPFNVDTTSFFARE